MRRKKITTTIISIMLGTAMLFSNIYGVAGEPEGVMAEDENSAAVSGATEWTEKPEEEDQEEKSDITGNGDQEAAENSEPGMTEAPAPTVTEAPAPTETETPAPAVTEAPDPAVTETPAPTATEAPEPGVTEVPEPAVTEAPAPTVTETPDPTVTETPASTVTGTPEPAVTEAPEPAVTEVPQPDVTMAPSVTPTVSVTPVPSVTPTEAPKGIPKILSLTGEGTGNILEKLSPAFSPDTYVYHFLDSGMTGRTRLMTATVENGVTVTVNGQETPVRKDGTCTLKILYQGETSENDVVLTRTSTGETSVYQFHTYAHSVKNYSSEYRLVDSKGQQDDKNIGALTLNSGSFVYDSYVNLDKVRLKMQACPPSGKIFQADLTDASGSVIDSFFVAGEEDAESVELQSKILRLAQGQNIFYLKCYNSYDDWEDGSHVVKQGVCTVTFRIYRNSGEEEKETDTTLKNVELYINGSGGKNYIGTFSPDKRIYKVMLPVEDFDEALEMNRLWLSAEGQNSGQEIEVYGGSAMNGISGSALKKQENGYYSVGKYKPEDLYSSDSFKINIKVTAKNKIDSAYYRIFVEKTGKSGMVIPDVYRNTSFNIVPSQPEWDVQLVLGSTNIYDDGEIITGFQAIAGGNLTIDIADTDVIYQNGKGSSGSFTIRLNKAGRTAVKVVYDDGNLYFEDEITVSVYYSISYLVNEIHVAAELLDTADSGSRIYPEEARNTFEEALHSARLVYIRYVNAKLTDEQKQEITDAAVALKDAEEVFRKSECGKHITAFEPLDSEIADQEVATDASILEVKRPKTLTATVDGKKETISGIKWTSRPVWNVKEYERIIYRFTPVLPAGYVLADEVEEPVITVVRETKAMDILVKRTIPLDESILVQHVPWGTPKSDLILPSSLEMYKNEWMGEESEKVSVPVRWRDLDGYNGEVSGTYTFHSVIDPFSTGFKMATNTTLDPMQTITVIVDEKKENPPGDDDKPKPPADDNGKDDKPKPPNDDNKKDDDHNKKDDPGNKPGNGGHNGNGNGGGTGKGNGNGKGNNNGNGNGHGKGQGHGKSNGSGSGSGTKTQKGNGKGTGNNGTSEKGGEGGTGNQPVPARSNTAGENSGNDLNTAQNAGGFESTGNQYDDGGSTGGAMLENDSGDISEARTDTGSGDEVTESGDAQEQEEGGKHWKVAEVAEETVSTRKSQLGILGIIMLLFLLLGGFREYRKYRRENGEKKKEER